MTAARPEAPPTFTVVMPAFNAAATIDSAIRSVLAQTRDDFELVVVDDGSTDTTAARVLALSRDDPRIALVQQANGGLGAARNAALARARGRYVSLLDSDDVWMPRYLDAMGAALDADPGAGMAYTDAWILDDASRRIRRLKALGEFDPPERPPADPRALFRMLVDRNFIFVSVTLRRSVIEAVGPFRTDVLGVEDYELWLRLAAHGHRFVRVPAHLALYRRHAGQLSQDPLLMAAKQLAVFRVVLAEYRLGEPDRVLVERRLAGLERAVAAMEGRSRPRAAALRARRLLGRVKRRVLDRRIWRSEPPAEVSAVFGDLGAL